MSPIFLLPAEALVQRAGAREMRAQVLHLVGQHATALQVFPYSYFQPRRWCSGLERGKCARRYSISVGQHATPFR